MEGKAGSRWHKLLREPLLHFIAIGALLFGVYATFGETPAVAQGPTIQITANDIRQIVVAWIAQGRPPLTREQLQKLIDQKVTEEILFREGVALGLDRNDEIIKRRVAQKMDFLAADVAALQEPDRAELNRWFTEHTERFALPARMSFRQLYFSPEKRGRNARIDAQAALKLIADKPDDATTVAAVSDPITLRDYYSDATPDQVLKEFGPAFSTELFKLEPGGWRGPIQSGYGWHLVWIDSVVPARVPRFDEVEADVRTAWRDQRYVDIKKAALAEMRALYTVVIPPLESVDMNNLLGTSPTSSVSPEAYPK